MTATEPQTGEIFPRPTVKQVIFQIRFPNLFYIENKIGELQLEIMEEFPESSLLMRRQVVFADMGPEVKLEDIVDKFGEKSGPKVWQFSSPKGYKLNVLSSSLDITSELHKTYDSERSDNRFRDVIALVLDRFFKIAKIPLINRVGLRYIDECPLPDKSNSTYKDYYNTAFNLDKFALEDASQMDFQTIVKRGNYSLRYIESLQNRDNKHLVVLDFDGSATEVKPSRCLAVTDDLHRLIIKEFHQTIKKPVVDYMRRQGD